MPLDVGVKRGLRLIDQFAVGPYGVRPGFEAGDGATAMAGGVAAADSAENAAAR